jgi:hypothetical protein
MCSASASRPKPLKKSMMPSSRQDPSACVPLLPYVHSGNWIFPGTVSSNTPEEDRHIVPAANGHKQRVLQPGLGRSGASSSPTIRTGICVAEIPAATPRIKYLRFIFHLVREPAVSSRFRNSPNLSEHTFASGIERSPPCPARAGGRNAPFNLSFTLPENPLVSIVMN